LALPKIILGARKLLNIRDIAKQFLRLEVGNGENLHLWLDFWHPDGILINKYGYRVVYDAHSRMEAKLSSVIHNGDWFWRHTRSKIQARLPKVNLGFVDIPIWTAPRKGVFVSSDTWEVFREKKEPVSW
jgi:hypothetical protein